MPTLDAMTAELLTRLAAAREEARRAAALTAPGFNVFDYLAPDENLLSHVLADLLDPAGPHGQGDVFLRGFLTAADLPVGVGPGARVRVRREVYTDRLPSDRRIDVLVEIDGFGLGIENKPWAPDQPDQLADYERHLRSAYGDERFALVYLSGSGKPPSSLPEPARLGLESAGRFRTVTYHPVLRDWVRGCANACRADPVRTFLRDFARYIGVTFGGEPAMPDRIEDRVFLDHARSGPDGLALAAGFARTFPAVREEIVAGFLRVLAGRVTDELAATGGGWRVLTRQPGGGLAIDGHEWLAVVRDGWPRGGGSDDALRVTIATERNEPHELYFQLRREKMTDRQAFQTADATANRIAAAATAAAGRGYRLAIWWPFWWRGVDEFSDWTDPDTVVQLAGKGDPLDYFVARLVRLAVAVDGALAEPPG